MWTRRKLFPTLDVPALRQPAAASTRFFQQQHLQKSGAGEFTLDEDAYNFLSSLSYTLVTSLSRQEAAELLTWVLPPRWVDPKYPSSEDKTSTPYKNVLSLLLQNEEVLRACSQVEYFFYGTDNGQVFLMPLLPPHLLEVLMAETGEGALPGLVEAYRREAQLVRAAPDASVINNNNTSAHSAMSRVPVNCVGRRLLHRHIREEPVTAIDHLGVLFASAASSVDHAVALSIFHPTPMGVVCIEHPCPVRSLKLWEGAVFTSESESDKESNNSNDSDNNNAGALQRQRWSAQVRDAEPVAVYVFTGDDAGLVRLWRVDVVRRTYALQHVLVCSDNMTGMRSPLTPFAREDTSKKVPSRDVSRVLHCLEVDVSSNRLFGGTEGGAYVWALDALPWRGPDDAAAAPSSACLAVGHPLCWDEAHRCPLPCALHCWEKAQEPSSSSSSPLFSHANAVDYRVARLVNHHVWILNAPAVQAEMTRAQEQHQQEEQQQQRNGNVQVSGWKAKYGRVITNGAAVGVVSNNVRLKEVAAVDDLAARLTSTVVTVTFDGGELKNDLRAPLSCVVPVVYPLAFLRTPGTACFALRVLAPHRRVLTSCADGRVCVWGCKPGEDAHAAETYAPQIVTENRQEHRGLGRHLCVLRSPDIFVSCSFDDGLVREWHVYDAPELLLRCARRFTLTSFISDSGVDGSGGGHSTGNAKGLAGVFKRMAQAGEEKHKADTTGHGSENEDGGDDDDLIKAADGGDVVAGISCAAACPAFGALFLVGAFESAIQTYSLTEVVGCEPPRNFIYNGHKTVHLPASMPEDVYREL